MKLDRILYKKKDIVTRTIGSEVFLVPIHQTLKESQKLYVLNPIAEFIWNQLNGKNRLDDINRSILLEFDVEKNQALDDMKRFIQKLEQEDLVLESGESKIT